MTHISHLEEHACEVKDHCDEDLHMNVFEGMEQVNTLLGSPQDEKLDPTKPFQFLSPEG